MSADSIDGNEDRCHITGLDHALRVATLAKRHRQLPEVTFMALVHDLARPLSDPYHGEVIAEVVRDIVSEINYNVLRTHGEYQSAYIHGHEVDESVPWHNMAKSLCAWEVGSFAQDWSIPTMTIEEAIKLIEDMVGDRA